MVQDAVCFLGKDNPAVSWMSGMASPTSTSHARATASQCSAQRLVNNGLAFYQAILDLSVGQILFLAQVERGPKSRL